MNSRVRHPVAPGSRTRAGGIATAVSHHRATGPFSYVLKLDGYSRAKRLLKTGKCLISSPFSVGGHSWAVRFYPKGTRKDNANFISLHLVLDSAHSKDVKEQRFRVRLPNFYKRVDLEQSPHLRDDCLTIRCDATVTVMKDSDNEETRVLQSNLHQHLGDLLKNKVAADLTFQVSGHSFSAHRCVLVVRSSVFKAELFGSMKESSGGPIEICDMEADVFKSLLHFVYTDSVLPVLESASNKWYVVMAAHLLVAADRYNIGRLKMICVEKLCNHIDSEMVATSLALAEQHGFHRLREACLKFLACPPNLEAMMASDGFEHLKSSYPSVLKELIASSMPVPSYQAHLHNRMAEHCKISAALVAEERSYVLKVDGYSRTKGLVKTGEFMTSTAFSVGGHIWAMLYYPNGTSKDYANFISLYLHLYPADDDYAKAKYTISVLDKDQEPVPSFSRSVHQHTFTRKVSTWGCHDCINKANLDESEHLRDDCLTMRCDVTIMETPSGVPPTDLHRHLSDLLKSNDAADLTFQVGGERISAHRCVLAAGSPVFKAQLLGAMKENSPGSPIEICDMEADVFKSLLHFIYADTFPPVLQSAGSKGAEERRDVVMAGHLLVAADRYDIWRLKLICEEMLCNRIDSEMVATSLALVEQHGFHSLKEACLEFLACPSNLEVMMASDGFEHLKSSCPSVLKDLLVRILPAELKAAKDLFMAI